MSIMEVAKVAGVSQATVSRVINGRPGVSPARVQLVQDAMNELGYRPPPLARRPGRRQPKRPQARASIIAVLILDGLYRYTPGILAAHLRGIESGAAAHGLNMVVAHATDPAALPPIVANQQADGLILMGSDASPAVLSRIEGMNAIWFGSHHGPSGDTVLAGNYQIGRLAADYLLDRGHTQVAFLCGMGSYPAYPTRAEAFQFTVQRRGGVARTYMDDRPRTVTGDPSEMITLRDVINQGVAKLLEEAPQTTGLFVPNDMMTAVVYPALERRGRQPGRDIDIISCNNEAAYLVGLDPRPATIDIGAEMMGRHSVEQLLLRMDRREDSRQVQVAVKPVLVEGEA